MEEEKYSRIDAKYIFIDIVNYSLNRSIEAQTEIVDVMNNIVSSTIKDRITNPDQSILYLPTGDGICIVLNRVAEPYDIHILIATDIIRRLKEYNHSISDKKRMFEVRVGINESMDNLITDINGRPNVAGAGINLTQRIMADAEESQIFVSQIVFDKLRYWEKYMGMFNRYGAKVKHNQHIYVYHLIKDDFIGLNTDIPEKYKIVEKEKEKVNLSLFVACYMANCIKYENAILNYTSESMTTIKKVAVLYYYFKAIDEAERRTVKATDAQKYYRNAKFADLLKWIKSIDYFSFMYPVEVCFFLKIKNELSSYSHVFEPGSYDTLIINSNGRDELKNMYPEIWKSFDLDNPVQIIE